MGLNLVEANFSWAVCGVAGFELFGTCLFFREHAAHTGIQLWQATWASD